MPEVKDERPSRRTQVDLTTMPLIDLLQYAKSIGITQDFEKRKHILEFLKNMEPPPQLEVRLTQRVDAFRGVAKKQLTVLNGIQNACRGVPVSLQTTLFQEQFPGRGASSLSCIESRLNEPNTYLVVVGDVSSGKSLFLNTFLFGDEVVPSASGKCSPAICKVVYGAERALFAEHSDGKFEKLASFDGLDSSKVRARLASRELVNQNGQYTIHWDNPLLKTGLSFVDTPGFNDIGFKTERVMEFVKNATGFVIMIHAEIGVSETVNRLLREVSKDFPPSSVFFIVTHLDLEDDEANRIAALAKIFKELDRAFPSWLPDNFCTVNLKAAAKGLFTGLYMPLDYRSLLSKFVDFLEDALTNKASIMQSRVQQKQSLAANLISGIWNAARSDETTKQQRRAKIEVLERSFNSNKARITRLGSDVLRQELAQLAVTLEQKIDSFLTSPQTAVDMQALLDNFSLTYTGNEEAQQYFLQYIGQLRKFFEDFVELELRGLTTNLIFNVATAMQQEWARIETELIDARIMLTEQPTNRAALPLEHVFQGNLSQPTDIIKIVSFVGALASLGIGVGAAITTGGLAGLGWFAAWYLGGGSTWFLGGFVGELLLSWKIDWQAKNIFDDSTERAKFIQLCLAQFRSQTADRSKLVEVYLEPVKTSGDKFLDTALAHLQSTFVEVNQLSTLASEIVQDGKLAHEYEGLHEQLVTTQNALRKLELYSDSKWNIKPQHLEYDEKDIIGRGKGSVVRGNLRDNGQKVPVAVKSMTVGAKLLQEAEVLCSLCHPNIVKFYGVCFPGKMLLVYERCDLSLEAFRLQHPFEPLRTSMALDIANGMLYLQSRGFVHRDLTATNVLICGVNTHPVAKIADFGEAKSEIDINGTPDITTPIYAAPEKYYSRTYDTYSFGLILWQMWHTQSLVDAWLSVWNDEHKMNPEHYLTIKVLEELRERGSLPRICPSTPSNIANLIRACCDLTPTRRPKWETVLLGLTQSNWCLEGPVKARSTRPLRILSLDGGGTAAVILLTILEYLLKLASEELGKSVSVRDLFDMIGGTSTGGIVSLGLGGHGMTVAEGLDLYLSGSRTIFPSSAPKRLVRLIRGQPMFDHAPLENLLKEHFGAVRLSALSLDPKIFTVARRDCDAGPFLFRNYNCTHRLATPANQDAYTFQAARATACPPLILERLSLEGHVFGDGGVGFNNPCNLAVDEAVALSLEAGDAPEGSVACLLSLGCGNATSTAPTGDSIFTLTKSTLAETEHTHKSMLTRSVQCGFFYERLNPSLPVNFHLWESDPGSLKLMIEHTQQYLRSEEVESKLKALLPHLLLPLRDPVRMHMGEKK